MSDTALLLIDPQMSMFDPADPVGSAEGDLVLDKTTRDTFASTALGDELEARGIKRLLVAGFQSEFCVRETTLGALGRGFDVTLVSDGHSTRDKAGRLEDGEADELEPSERRYIETGAPEPREYNGRAEHWRAVSAASRCH
jgi:hypothetical protein